MAKAPAFQFYVMDWMADLDEHPLEIEGAWIRICCKLWREQERGRATKPLAQWAAILRLSEDKAMEILDYIGKAKIGDVALHVTLGNKNVTVECRRMRRDAKELENTRLRVRRFRSNAPCNADVTVPSSSSPSSSSSCNSKELHLADEFMTSWNALGTPFKTARAVSGKRLAALNARAADLFWMENWRVALDRIKASPFCRGENERGWIADVDFFLRPDSVLKAVEGKYDGNGVRRGPEPTKAGVANRPAEAYTVPDWQKE
jgi:hypothetical protein